MPELQKLKVIPQQEHFTELFLEDYANLPKNVSQDNSVSFSFTIRNLEGEAKDYGYLVYSKNSDGTVRMEKSKIRVGNGEFRTVHVDYKFATVHDTELIFVELPDEQQKIHFQLINKFNQNKT